MRRSSTHRIVFTLAALFAVCLANPAGASQGPTGGGASEGDFRKGVAEVSTEGFFAKGEVPWLLARETGALSVHFNPGTAQLGATAETADAPMSATWVGAFRIPITLPTRLGGPRARHFLRGVVAKDADTRIRFVLDVGGEKPLAGQMYAEEFPYGKSMDEQFVREFPFRPRVRGVGHYSGTVIVTIERRKPGARAELHLSSLDLATDPTDRGRKKGKSRGK